jgi:hypothetical protein
MQLLETWNMVNQFQLYLKFEKKKSVDKTRNWITTKIAEANSKVLECYDGNRNNLITATISRDTAHRWMLLHECSYEKYTRTYYTDSHNSPSTVSYRNTEYIPKLDVIESLFGFLLGKKMLLKLLLMTCTVCFRFQNLQNTYKYR